jgi:hypothetical protein
MVFMLANRNRRKHPKKAREALGQFEAPPPPPQTESAEAFLLRVAGIDIRLCPRCRKGRMRWRFCRRRGVLPQRGRRARGRRGSSYDPVPWKPTLLCALRQPTAGHSYCCLGTIDLSGRFCDSGSQTDGVQSTPGRTARDGGARQLCAHPSGIPRGDGYKPHSPGV